MTAQETTLIAAVIAAFASVAKLFFDRFSENRSSFRALLQPLVAELGEALHGIVSTCNVMGRVSGDTSYANWRKKAEVERDKLKELRPQLRYPLWGIDEGLRVLIRLPEWTAHAKGQTGRLVLLNKRATRLRGLLDVVALRCYRNGRLPDALERLQVRLYAWHCRRVFENGPTSDEE
ncbi:hypothetical protein [Simplicispira lacusdiani]|uniref:hypothetical protein n=1 Tax=Simplicispira lacusdiani TaxID=2213010 RepID=UPI0013002070|nr:hypothetical protein [Simplicispira lacusdiani]